MLVEGSAKHCDGPIESVLIGRAAQVIHGGPNNIHGMLEGC